MKKTIVSLLVAPAVALASSAVSADYTGPGAKPVDVAAITKAPVDDMDVVLVGRVTERLSGETYLFTDETGSIQVEIDYEDLPTAGFNEKTRVRIEGEVEVGGLERTEIEVERLTVI